MPVYLFYNINIHDGYSYVGNGFLENDATGEKIGYSQKKINSSGSVFFDNISRKTHTVSADASELFKITTSNLHKIQTVSINLDSQLHNGEGEINLTFDIWPYDTYDDIWN